MRNPFHVCPTLVSRIVSAIAAQGKYASAGIRYDITATDSFTSFEGQDLLIAGRIAIDQLVTMFVGGHNILKVAVVPLQKCIVSEQDWCGSGSNGNTHAHTVITPLRREVICTYFVSGSIDVDRTNFSGIFDYGSGDCDNQATFTFDNGTVIDVILN